MKTYKTIAVLFLFAFAFSLVSCGNKENKEKLKNFYMNAIEFYKSDDFKTNILDDEYVVNKEKEIIKGSGFENEEEFQEIKMKLANDDEVYKLSSEMNSVILNTIKEQYTTTMNRLKVAEDKLEKIGQEFNKATEEIDRTLDKDKEAVDTEKNEKEAKEKEAKEKEKTTEKEDSKINEN